MPTRCCRSCIGCRWNNASRTSWSYWRTRHDRRHAVPEYLSRHITTRSSTRSLRSSSTPLLEVPFRQTSSGKRSFSTAAPSVWNSLPTSVLNCDTLTLFKARHKTHLFSSVSGKLARLSASASESIAPRRSTNRVLLGRVAVVAQRPIVVKLSRGRYVGLYVRASVGLSSALWKNGGSDPDAVWHRRSDGSRDEAGSRVWGSVYGKEYLWGRIWGAPL